MFLEALYSAKDNLFEHKESYTFSLDHLDNNKLPYVTEKFIQNYIDIKNKTNYHLSGNDILYEVKLDNAVISVRITLNRKELSNIQEVDVDTLKNTTYKQLVTFLRSLIDNEDLSDT